MASNPENQSEEQTEERLDSTLHSKVDGLLVVPACDSAPGTIKQPKIRLDAFVASCLDDVSRSEATKWIKAGGVYVNQVPQIKPGFGLVGGDTVECRQLSTALPNIKNTQRSLPPRENYPVLDEIELLHEDEDLFVFSKPPGLTVHPGAGTDQTWTFIDEIKRRYPMLVDTFAGCSGSSGTKHEIVDAADRPGLVHRLDKDTSGAIVVAKNQASLRFLQACFLDRSIKRFYVCLQDGVLTEPTTTVEAWHVRSPTDRKKFLALEKDSKSRLVNSAKHACSHFQQLKVFESRLSLSRVRLDTGRTHQIRVHAAYLHKWIVGDSSYGRPFAGGSKLGDVAAELSSFPRQFLHAYRVVVPRKGQTPPLDIYCPPYHDMLPILGSLGCGPKIIRELLHS